MAGDWIKFEIATSDKPEVWAIAQRLSIDPDAVVGKLLRVWSWFDQHTENGNAPTVTKMLLDRVVGVTGFCDAVISSGWMIESNGEISLPNFDRHNGKTAKNRATTAKRVASFKEKSKESNAGANAKVTPAPLPREEKRREDINNSASPHSAQEKSNRGTRLPRDWKPTQEYFDAAKELNPNILDARIVQIGAEFRDYWIAKSGAGATKVDWMATWRNWVRKEPNHSRPTQGAPPRFNPVQPTSLRDRPLVEDLTDKGWAAGLTISGN